MALLNLVNKLSNLGNFGARIARSKVLSAVWPRYIQASSKLEAQPCEKAKEAVKQGANEAKEASENMKAKANSTAGQVNETVKEMTNKAKDATQEMNAKANDVAQNAWDSAKELAQKAKDSVLGKANESKEAIKENAEKIKQSMSKKN